MDLQVLVVTMNQQDFSLVDRMNIKTNVIFANQTNENCFDEKEYEFGTAQMISTKTRGVGINRNIALLASEAEILLFSDDDMCYYDGTLESVKEAFSKNPTADVIIFSLDITKNGEIIRRKHHKTGRAYLWNSLKYGTVVVAVKRKALLRANIKFSEIFGGGCPFSCGEDSLFIKECFNNRLKVYKHSYVLGSCSKDSSSWFTGFGDKYLYDKGVLLSFLFPKIKYLVAVYFGYRFKKMTKYSFFKNIKMINKGIKNAKELKPYSDSL